MGDSTSGWPAALWSPLPTSVLTGQATPAVGTSDREGSGQGAWLLWGTSVRESHRGSGHTHRCTLWEPSTTGKMAFLHSLSSYMFFLTLPVYISTHLFIVYWYYVSVTQYFVPAMFGQKRPILGPWQTFWEIIFKVIFNYCNNVRKRII